MFVVYYGSLSAYFEKYSEAENFAQQKAAQGYSVSIDRI